MQGLSGFGLHNNGDGIVAFDENVRPACFNDNLGSLNIWMHFCSLSWYRSKSSSHFLIQVTFSWSSEATCGELDLSQSTGWWMYKLSLSHLIWRVRSRRYTKIQPHQALISNRLQEQNPFLLRGELAHSKHDEVHWPNLLINSRWNVDKCGQRTVHTIFA